MPPLEPIPPDANEIQRKPLKRRLTTVVEHLIKETWVDGKVMKREESRRSYLAQVEATWESADA